MQEKVEASFEDLKVKLEKLIADTQDTSEEYFEVVEFANAYNILVPPVNSSTDFIKSIIHNGKLLLVVFEALAFVIYIAVAFAASVKEESAKKVTADGDDADDDDDDDDFFEDEEDDEDKEEEEKSEKKAPAQNKNKRRKK